MKIRLTGTPAETRAASVLLARLLPTTDGPLRFAVREVSDFYRNRGGSQLGRVYLEVDAHPAGEVSGDAG